MQEIQKLYKKINCQVASSEIKTLLKEFKGLKEEKLKKIISSSGLLEEMSRKIQSSKTNSIKIQIGYGFPENVILKLHVQLWGQRVSCIGNGNESCREFNIEITANDFKESVLHAVVIKQDGEELEILGVGEIDLKEEICLKKLSTVVKIRDLHHDQVIVGVLNVDLSDFDHFLDSEKENFKIQRKIKVKEEQYKAFVNYAKKWWNQFLQIRSSHERRLVKIFVNSERGKTVVSAFIYPIKETPNHAARFTGLIPFEESKETALVSDVWQDLHTFLSLGKGSGIDHAILLCNLFLGFSLEAFVTLGLDSNALSKAWVTVLNNDKPEFWDPLSGTVISSESISSLGCIFNNSKFYANISPLEFPNNFILSQSCNWKELSLPTTVNPVQLVSILCHPLSLLENTLKVEADIRDDLIKFIKAYRSNISLDTVISEELSWIQSQTLWHQEFSKLVKEYKNQEQLNQMGIKALLKPQEIYRGFPLQVNFLNSYRMFSLITASKTGRKILLSSRDNTRLGVSVRVYFYGESSVSVWLLFSAIYK